MWVEKLSFFFTYTRSRTSKREEKGPGRNEGIKACRLLALGRKKRVRAGTRGKLYSGKSWVNY